MRTLKKRYGYQREGRVIVTKYLGPTNARGGRVQAKTYADKVTVPWDHAVGVDENHHAAAMALLAKKGWHGRLVGGNSPDQSGRTYVLLLSRDPNVHAVE